MYNEQEQMKRLSQRYKNLFDDIKNGECDERTHAERMKLDLDLSKMTQSKPGQLEH